MVAPTLIIAVILVLAILASFLLVRSRGRYKWIAKEKEKFGVPQGKITYTDLNKPAEPLFSASLGLLGKPDYIVEISNKHIPVEVKSSKARRPYRNHVLQLAAYCLLIEDVYNETVPFGVLTYSGGRQFAIPFVAILREEVLKSINEMRMRLASKSGQRNHNVSAKCKFCRFRKFCDQRII